jgi:hypothetical protein
MDSHWSWVAAPYDRLRCIRCYRKIASELVLDEQIDGINLFLIEHLILCLVFITTECKLRDGWDR